MKSRDLAPFSARSLHTLARLILVLVGSFPLAAHAEHRVALLIDNSRHVENSQATPRRDLDALAAALGAYGVRCTVARDLDEPQLKQTIDHFAVGTPTASTAIVCFAGHAVHGQYKGKTGVYLLGTNSKKDRGYALDNVLESLHNQGGSRLNIILIDSPQTPQLKHELPDGCLVAFHDHALLAKNLDGPVEMLAAIQRGSALYESTVAERVTVTGKGSEAVSPPNQFVRGTKAGDEWINPRGTIFVWCPPGRYTKGSPVDEPGRYSDENQQTVVIEQGFWISKYELTCRENLRGRPAKSIASSKDHPLTMINHDDIRRMTQQTMTQEDQKLAGLPRDWEYNLPSEEQWEYAARAGTTTAYYFGNDVSQLPDHANFADKTWYDTGEVFALRADQTLEDGVAKLARVGLYQPNSWGLHDIHGNVAEWCLNGAVRGGSWASTPASCRVALRHHFGSREEQNFIGYRLVIQQVQRAR